MFKINPHCIFWQKFFHLLRPFDDSDGVRILQNFFKAEMFKFGGLLDSIRIDMHQTNKGSFVVGCPSRTIYPTCSRRKPRGRLPAPSRVEGLVADYEGLHQNK